MFTSEIPELLKQVFNGSSTEAIVSVKEFYMPSAYLIVLYNEIGDPRGLDQYAALAAPAIEKAGGTLIAKGYRRVHMKRVAQIFQFWCALTV
jgi:hypothetical protein